MIASIEQIMHDQGVGKKRAYAIRRRLQNEAHVEPIPTNQRNRVLEVLYRRGEEIHHSHELMAVLQGEGYAIDEHDAAKVLWSLQKTNHVKFREGHSRYGNRLFAIRLTLLGVAAAQTLSMHEAKPILVLEDLSDVEMGAGPEDLSDVKEVAQRAAAMQQAVNDLGAGRPEPMKVVLRDFPEPEPSIFHLDEGGFPEFRSIRDRARNAKKLAQAAAILEEVGEDEIALQLMTRTEFTPLEKEVIELLERYEEI